MIKNLIKLSKVLKSFGYKKESKYIVSLAKDILSGDVPDFDWILDGSVFGTMAISNPKWFDDFIDYNSNKILEVLNGAKPIRFIGSGATGDAWLLSDGKVLKLFDANATVKNISGEQRSALEDAELIEESQWSGKADPSQPKIYDYGRFNYDDFGPDEFTKTRSSSRLNRNSVSPAYILMEGVATSDELLERYIKSNNQIENDENKKMPIEESEVPYKLLYSYNKTLASGEYEDFIREFSEHINTEVSDIIQKLINDYWETWQQWEELEEDPDILFVNFDDPKSIDGLVKNVVFAVENSDIQNSLSKYEEILSLPKDWLPKLARAMINNIKMGRSDVHGKNWGFRGDQPVFFDA